jgi:hypothetical protein
MFTRVTIENVVNSFQKFLYESNIPCYIYTNTDENIEVAYTCRPKTSITALDKTFIVQVKVGTLFYDGINANPYFLKNRYVKFTKSGVITHIKIISYNNTNGEITLESPFGQVMTTSDEFEIVVLDSMFLTDLSHRDLGNQMSYQNTFIRFDMTLKTKFDSNKTKIRSIINSLQDTLGNGRCCKIYNSSNVHISQLNFNDNGNYNPLMEQKEHIIAYLGSVSANYYTSR